jgi:hypothetical protein
MGRTGGGFLIAVMLRDDSALRQNYISDSNPKLEILNPKQFRIRRFARLFKFPILIIRACFEIRHSDFEFLMKFFPSLNDNEINKMPCQLSPAARPEPACLTNEREDAVRFRPRPVRY